MNLLTSTEKRSHFGGNLPLKNDNAVKSIRSTPTFDLTMQQQQQKSKNRYFNRNYFKTEYYDLDQPEE